jgi:hypothetical protein
MMWSQCTCDMKTLTVAGRPRLAREHVRAERRAPLPMSHT